MDGFRLLATQPVSVLREGDLLHVSVAGNTPKANKTRSRLLSPSETVHRTEASIPGATAAGEENEEKGASSSSSESEDDDSADSDDSDIGRPATTDDKGAPGPGPSEDISCQKQGEKEEEEEEETRGGRGGEEGDEKQQQEEQQEEELRIDASDGNAYNIQSFLDVYGGLDEWWKAAPASRVGTCSSSTTDILSPPSITGKEMANDPLQVRKQPKKSHTKIGRGETARAGTTASGHAMRSSASTGSATKTVFVMTESMKRRKRRLRLRDAIRARGDEPKKRRKAADAKKGRNAKTATVAVAPEAVAGGEGKRQKKKRKRQPNDAAFESSHASTHAEQSKLQQESTARRVEMPATGNEQGAAEQDGEDEQGEVMSALALQIMLKRAQLHAQAQQAQAQPV